MGTETASQQHVAVRSVSKRFGGVQALSRVDLDIGRGEIHALVGENGAGKSTLGRIIAGSIAPDEGELVVAGRPVRFSSPHDAIAQGITIIDQELALVPGRSVLDNVFLGSEPRKLGFVRQGELRARFAELERRSRFGLDPDAVVRSLRTAEQQKVEILRAITRDAKLIVMDEPTTTLSLDEAEKLFQIIRDLRERGTTIVYVSHFLREVLALADTVTVLKDGRLVRSAPARAETPESLVTAMLGRSLEVTFPEKSPPPTDAPVVLSVSGLSRAGAFADVAFSLKAGEIVGLAGLIGSGRSEVARAIFAADPRNSGTIELDGSPVAIRKPRDAIRRGIALLPESRKTQGLHMRRSVVENVSLPHLRDLNSSAFVRLATEWEEITDIADRLDIRTESVGSPVWSLSGGNQQKVLFAKWLLRPPRVLIADEPTRGVDVGAKRSIYELIHRLAAGGMAVLLISSELEEVLGLAHRVLVMRAGRLVAELGGDTDEETVMRAAFAAKAPPTVAAAS